MCIQKELLITAWETLRTACANLRRAIDTGLHAYFEEYLAETGETPRRQRSAGFPQALEGRGGVERLGGENRAKHQGRG